MADSEQEYNYTPLPSSRYIRILVVQPPRKPRDVIQCSFLEESLDDDANSNPNYEALSYTWGNPTGSRPIICEGKRILVTPNCEQALLHLRQRFRPRRVWVDAVCINQQSVSEKNTQVPMMCDIYRRASRTIMWLGPDTDPEQSAVLRRAAKYGAAINMAINGLRKIRNSQPSFWWEWPILSQDETDRIVRVCNNEWFRRMWTMQEFLLSQSPVFRIGKVECAAEDLYSYFCMGKNIVRRDDLDHYMMRNDLRNPTYSSHYEAEGFVSDMVRLAARNDASDPRDKVYGMVAWIRHSYPSFELPDVNYAASFPDVFERFTRCFIATTKTLHALELVNSRPAQPECSENPRNVDKVPTWVLDLRHPELIAPDWRQTNMKDLPSSQYQYAADALRPSHPGQLVVCARKVAIVILVSSRMPFLDTKSNQTPSIKSMDHARTECLSEWTALAATLDLDEDLVSASPYRFYASSKHNSDFHALNPCSNPHTRALERMTTDFDYLRQRHEPIDTDDDQIIASGFDTQPPKWVRDSRAAHQTQTSDKENQAQKKKKIKHNQRKRKDAEADRSFANTSQQNHDMCALFFTNTGHLGECQGDLRIGDDIYILEGANYPFVLRKTSVRRQHTVVGKATVERPFEARGEWDPGRLGDDPEARRIVLV